MAGWDAPTLLLFALAAKSVPGVAAISSRSTAAVGKKQGGVGRFFLLPDAVCAKRRAVAGGPLYGHDILGWIP